VEAVIGDGVALMLAAAPAGQESRSGSATKRNRREGILSAAIKIDFELKADMGCESGDCDCPTLLAASILFRRLRGRYERPDDPHLAFTR
jgi:hypothetical protein